MTFTNILQSFQNYFSQCLYKYEANKFQHDSIRKRNNFNEVMILYDFIQCDLQYTETYKYEGLHPDLSISGA